jgi:allantoicase
MRNGLKSAGRSFTMRIPREDGWRNLTVLSDCEADKEHTFECLDQETVFTHVKLSIYPDGGVKRLRVFGVRAD